MKYCISGKSSLLNVYYTYIQAESGVGQIWIHSGRKEKSIYGARTERSTQTLL